jgi:hypothetical protein
LLEASPHMDSFHFLLSNVALRYVWILDLDRTAWISLL